MNRYVYDASMLIGVGLVGVGASMALGLSWGLVAAGVAVLAVTAFGAVMAGAR